MRNRKSNYVNSVEKSFICSSFNKNIICHSEYKQVTIGIWKEGWDLSPNNTKIKKIFGIPTLIRLFEYDTNLYLIVFPSSFGRHQQTHSENQSYEFCTV